MIPSSILRQKALELGIDLDTSPELEHIVVYKLTLESILELVSGDKRQLTRISIDVLIRDLLEIIRNIDDLRKKHRDLTRWFRSVQGFLKFAHQAYDALASASLLLPVHGVITASKSKQFFNGINQCREALEEALAYFRPMDIPTKRVDRSAQTSRKKVDDLIQPHIPVDRSNHPPGQNERPPRKNEASPDEEQEHVQQVLRTKRRRLRVLERQQATHGSLTPAHIILEIEDLQREIAELESQLKRGTP